MNIDLENCKKMQKHTLIRKIKMACVNIFKVPVLQLRSLTQATNVKNATLILCDIVHLNLILQLYRYLYIHYFGKAHCALLWGNVLSKASTCVDIERVWGLSTINNMWNETFGCIKFAMPPLVDFYTVRKF